MPAYGLSIQFDRSVFDDLIAALQAQEYLDVAAQAGVRTLMDYFAEKEADPATHKTANALGAAPVGLFGQFAQKTSGVATSDGFLISVKADEIRQRLHGGWIYPQNAKMLTIPARAESYGKTAATLGITLAKLYGRNGPYALVAASDYQHQVTRGPNKGKISTSAKNQKSSYGEGGVLFWLVDKVYTKPDPTTLPTDERLLGGIMGSIAGWFNRRFGGGVGGS